MKRQDSVSGSLLMCVDRYCNFMHMPLAFLCDERVALLEIVNAGTRSREHITRASRSSPRTPQNHDKRQSDLA